MDMKKLFTVLMITTAFIACGRAQEKAEEANKGEQQELKAEVQEEGLTYTIQDGRLLPVNGKPMIVDFGATWCPPCRQMEPIFEALKEEYKDKINFVKIDVDENPQLSQNYGVQNIPTLVFINREGNELQRLVGFQTRQQIVNVIDGEIHMD